MVGPLKSGYYPANVGRFVWLITGLAEKLKYSIWVSSLIALLVLLNPSWAQSKSILLFDLGQLSDKTYCFDKDTEMGPNDPRQLQQQSDRDSIRVALGTSGMAEATRGKCDYLVRYSIIQDQFQDIEMQPINVGPGPYWGGYPYRPGAYPGWGPAGGVSWVPVVVIRQRYQLLLDMFLNQRPDIQVYQGRASALSMGQDPRMMILNLAEKIMKNFPSNNQLLPG